MVTRASWAISFVCLVLMLAGCGGGSGSSVALEQTDNQTSRHLSLTELVAEVNEQALPKGADPAVFEQLKAKLISELTERYPSGVLEQVPSGEYGYVDELQFDTSGETISLTWDYTNYGDYSLNGLTNAGDIVEISSHFLKNPQSSDWSTACCADGDANGEVNSGDIVPLSQNYLGMVLGYNVYGAETAAGPWELISDVELSEGTISEGSLVMSFPLTTSHLFYHVKPYDRDGAEGMQSVVSGAAPLDTEWTHTWGSSSLDVFTAVTVDSLDNIYATGFTGETGSGPDDVESGTLIVTKVRPSGSPVWQKTYTSDLCTYGQGIAVDNLNNVYVAGVVRREASSDDVLILKLNSNGDLLYQYVWGGEDIDRATAIAVDGSNCIYVCGITGASGTGANLDLETPGSGFVIKLNPSGTKAWATTIGSSSLLNLPTAITVDMFDNVHIAGVADLNPMAAVCGTYTTLGADGTFGMQRAVQEADVFTSIILDPSGYVILGGYSDEMEGGFGGRDAIACKFMVDGNFEWLSIYGAELDDSLSQLCRAEDGRIYANGCITPGTGPQPALFQLSDTGELILQQVWRTTATDDDLSCAMALTGSGKLVVAGAAVSAADDTQAAASLNRADYGGFAASTTPPVESNTVSHLLLTGSLADVVLTEDTGAGEWEGWLKKTTPSDPSTNQTPVVDMQITVGNSGEVSFDVSGSSDPDGSIANILWNLDLMADPAADPFDTEFNEAGIESQFEGETSATYTYPESTGYRIQVQLVDNLGGITYYTSSYFYPVVPIYIYGYVYGIDETTPAPGVTIYVLPTGLGVTDSNGYYQVEVDPGNYNVVGSFDGYVVKPAAQTIDVGAVSVEAAPFHLEEIPPIVLQGYAVYNPADPLPLEGVGITAKFRDAATNAGTTTTDATGYWTLTFDYDQPANHAMMDVTAELAGATFVAATQSRAIDYTLPMPITINTFVAQSIAGQPVAVLTAPDLTGDPPLTQEYSLEGSYDDDGTIVEYFFDFGSGWVSNGSDATLEHTFDAPGSHTVKGKVVDDAGLFGQDQIIILLTGDIPTGLAADTLYIWPMTDTASVNEPVTVLVLTGPTTNPMKYLVSAVVSMPSVGAYTAESYNPGMVGGGQQGVDGWWINTGCSGFLSPPDNFITMSRDDFMAQRVSYEFNVTPLGGVDATGVEGVLFNFQVQFSEAGTHTLGIRDETVPRELTYYRSEASNDYHWSALNADASGNLLIPAVPNVITVTE